MASMMALALKMACRRARGTFDTRVRLPPATVLPPCLALRGAIEDAIYCGRDCCATLPRPLAPSARSARASRRQLRCTAWPQKGVLGHPHHGHEHREPPTVIMGVKGKHREHPAPAKLKLRNSLFAVELDDEVVHFARNLKDRPRRASGARKGKIMTLSFYSPYKTLDAAAKNKVLGNLVSHLKVAIDRMLKRVDEDKATAPYVETYEKGEKPKHVDSLISLKISVRNGRIVQLYVSQCVLDALVDSCGDMYLGTPLLDTVIKRMFSDTKVFYSLSLGVVPGAKATKVEHACIKIAKEEFGFHVCAQSEILDKRVRAKRGAKQPSDHGKRCAAGMNGGKGYMDLMLKCPNKCGISPFENQAGLTRHLESCTGPDFYEKSAAYKSRQRDTRRAKRAAATKKKTVKKLSAADKAAAKKWARKPTGGARPGAGRPGKANKTKLKAKVGMNGGKGYVDLMLKCPNKCGISPFENQAGLTRHLESCTGPDFYEKSAAYKSRQRDTRRAKRAAATKKKTVKKLSAADKAAAKKWARRHKSRSYETATASSGKANKTKLKAKLSTKKNVSKKPTAKKPAAKKPAAKPAPKKPSKKPAAKKPASKKPAAKKANSDKAAAAQKKREEKEKQKREAEEKRREKGQKRVHDADDSDVDKDDFEAECGSKKKPSKKSRR